jgi:hypothetical protein
LTDLHLEKLCMPETPAPGCEHINCLACDSELVGKTYCDGTRMMGCFLALDTLCGLGCEAVALAECEPAACEGEPGEAECGGRSDNPCWQRHCDPCGALLANESGCHANSLASCMSLPLAEGECKDVCALSTVACPVGQTCVDDAGPTCQL